MANLARRNLTIAGVATRQGVTPRYVRMLFKGEGTTFSDFVLEPRLLRAHRMLTDPRYGAKAVNDVAYQCGFGDLSHFNRAFRRRFGATPSDVRSESDTQG